MNQIRLYRIQNAPNQEINSGACTFQFDDEDDSPRHLLITDVHGEKDGSLCASRFFNLKNESCIDLLIAMAHSTGFPDNWYIHPCYPKRVKERFPQIADHIIGDWDMLTLNQGNLNWKCGFYAGSVEEDMKDVLLLKMDVPRNVKVNWWFIDLFPRPEHTKEPDFVIFNQGDEDERKERV